MSNIPDTCFLTFSQFLMNEIQLSILFLFVLFHLFHSQIGFLHKLVNKFDKVRQTHLITVDIHSEGLNLVDLRLAGITSTKTFL